jgi:hypothetical protein
MLHLATVDRWTGFLRQLYDSVGVFDYHAHRISVWKTAVPADETLDSLNEVDWIGKEDWQSSAPPSKTRNQIRNV